jgi:hypothetical protein
MTTSSVGLHASQPLAGDSAAAHTAGRSRWRLPLRTRLYGGYVVLILLEQFPI